MMMISLFPEPRTSVERMSVGLGYINNTTDRLFADGLGSQSGTGLTGCLLKVKLRPG